LESIDKNPWTTQSATEKYENPWIKVTEFQVINPAGKPGIYGKVHFKNKAIGIVAIDQDDNTWLVGQWRYPLNMWSWEIPEGGGPVGTDPLDAAKRELQEEAGLTANKWTLIQRVFLSNSVSDEEGFIFLAEDLKEGAHDREETEADMIVKKVSFREALAMVLDGRITDSLSIMALTKVAYMRAVTK
jgi:8-oxo-dGTP pyrophosphatase MutT (NUDIX family)